MTLKILFLTESREDYLADSVLHGLISLGHDVVDYPRKHVLYVGHETSSASPQISVRGHGFTLYGLLPDRHVDRTYVIQRLQVGWFDLVVIGQVWRQWGQLLDLAPFLQGVPTVLLDGDDDRRLFHRSLTRVRRYGWQPFPIRSGQCFYLKREWYGQSFQYSKCKVFPISFSVPAEKIKRFDLSTKTKRIATHCVDPEVALECRLPTSYAFATEEEYYYDLASSRYAVTTKRGGWDCLRHYEIAAAGCLPCFRNLDDKPATCAPHELQPGLNCIGYRDWPDLRRQLDQIDLNPKRYRSMLMASGNWIRQFTTISAAQRLIDLVLHS